MRLFRLIYLFFRAGYYVGYGFLIKAIIYFKPRGKLAELFRSDKSKRATLEFIIGSEWREKVDSITSGNAKFINDWAVLLGVDANELALDYVDAIGNGNFERLNKYSKAFRQEAEFLGKNT